MPQKRLPVANNPEAPWLDADGRYSEELSTAERKRLNALTRDERITDRAYYVFNSDTVRVDTINDTNGYLVRLVVNDNSGEWSRGGESPACHDAGYVLFGDYWSGYFPVGVPQKLTACKPN